MMKATTIHALIDDQATCRPMAPAIEAHDGAFSFQEAALFSTRLAFKLHHAHHAEKEPRMVVLMEKSALYPIVVLSVLKAGGVFVPLDPSHPKSRLSMLLDEIQPSVLITSSTLRPLAQSLYSRVVVADEKLIRSTKTQSRRLPRVRGQNAAYIIFTSGSTGKPKGVVIEHSSFVHSALSRGGVIGLDGKSRVLQYAAHSFDVSVDEILATLIHGGCVCIPSEADRYTLGDTMRALRVNHALLTATSASMLDPADVPELQTLQLGGELLSSEVIAKWTPTTRLFNVYGPSEASVACALTEVKSELQSGSIIGYSIGGICQVVDPDDHNNLLPPDTVGELLIGGPILARGYWQDSIRTKSSFIESPSWAAYPNPSESSRFYKTGDLAEMDSTGLIRIHGRKDNQIKVRGQRINVEEIESALKLMSWVQNVIVVLPYKGPLKGRLAAIVRITGSEYDMNDSCLPDVFSQAQMVDNSLLGQAYEELQSILPPAMVPSMWIQLPYLPQNSSLKTDRKLIKSWLEELDLSVYNGMVETNYVSEDDIPPESRQIYNPKYVEILSQVLGREVNHLQMDCSFIRNGGDSITAMELVREGKRAGFPLRMADVLSTHSLLDLIQMHTTNTVSSQAPSEEQEFSPISVSPVQKFFLDVVTSERDSFTQSVDLSLEQTVSETELKSATDLLVRTHPMLRARFQRQDNEWKQMISSDAVETSYSFSFSRAQTISDTVNTPQLSAEFGPVFHVELQEDDEQSQTLQLIAHHLVVDFVSWRIILDDLEKILQGDTRLDRTASFSSWSTSQQEYASMLDPEKVLPISIPEDNYQYWWPAEGELQNVHGNMTTSSFYIEEDETNAILDATYDLKPVEIMLGSFYHAFSATITDRETPAVFLESHGREEWNPSIDVGSTVGWFTTAFPINVSAESSKSLWESILKTREILRMVPNNGHPYWCQRFLGGSSASADGPQSSPMEWVFNFAGQSHHIDRRQSMFRRRSSLGMETAHPNAQRLSLFDILVVVEHGELNFTVSFPKTISNRDKIETLLNQWKESLYSIRHSRAAHIDRRKSISSFDCPKDVINMLEQCKEDLFSNVERTYKTSELQENFLRCQRDEPTYYKVRGTWTLEFSDVDARPDTEQLRMAWSQVVNNHTSLKTAFVYSSLAGHHFGIILGKVTPMITYARRDDLSEICAALKCSSGSSDGNVTISPPHLLVIHESSGNKLSFSLLFSHAIIDATSREIILEDILRAYQGQPLASDPSAYTDYLQSKTATSVLRAHPEPSRCIFPTDLMAPEDVSRDKEISSLVLPSSFYSSNIAEICRQQHVTLSSLVFTAWALTLSKYVQNDRLSFSYVKADRLVNGVEVGRSAGLYIDLLILNVQLHHDGTLWDVCRAVQKDIASGVLDGVIPAQSAQDPRNGHSDGLVNTMVNIRNVGNGSLKSMWGDVSLNLEGFDDPWDFDLGLAVNVSSNGYISCGLDYRASSVSAGLVTDVAGTLSTALDALLQNLNLTHSEWALMSNGGL